MVPKKHRKYRLIARSDNVKQSSQRLPQRKVNAALEQDLGRTDHQEKLELQTSHKFKQHF